MFRPAVLLALLVSCSASDSFLDKLNPKIVGGTAATIEEFPYMVSVQVNYFGFILLHRCGGSIISPQWVITAAHCTEHHDADSLKIRAGSDVEAIGGILKQVSQVIIHPNYNVGVTLNADIALLKVATAFTYSYAIQSVMLTNQTADVQSGTYGVVTGWGEISQGGSGSFSLLQLSVPMMSNEECTQFYNESTISEDVFCAGYQVGGKDPCKGDDGGPMVSLGQLIGIVSWGEGCGKPNSPAVYTSVAPYTQWISNNTGLLNTSDSQTASTSF